MFKSILNPLLRLKKWTRFSAHLLRRKAFRGGWILDYIRNRKLRLLRDLGHTGQQSEQAEQDSFIDVMVCIVDHFEPGEHRGDQVAGDRVTAWCEDYRELVQGHVDSDGVQPQHTWFYRFEYLNPLCVANLSKFAFAGLGEVEFHLHHGFDDHESFSKKLRDGISLAQQYGAMLTAEQTPQCKFAYIAGNWSLDNGSGDDSKSGCNTEIGALRDLGCFADFTFPAIGSKAQPRKVNAIYYANDCPKPKSYNTGTDVRVNGKIEGDLMICQGPTVIDMDLPYVETAAIESFAPPLPFRLDRWLSANVHVQGRPEWKFIKLHTHGTQSRDRWFEKDGEFGFDGDIKNTFDSMFNEMESKWKKGGYRLHYVTAREMFNIIKAAEAGHSGNPNDYRDYEIARPANRWISCEQPWRLVAFCREMAAVEFSTAGLKSVSFGFTQVSTVSGDLRAVKLLICEGHAVDLQITASGPIEVFVREPLSFEPTCFGVSSDQCKVVITNELNASIY